MTMMFGALLATLPAHGADDLQDYPGLPGKMTGGCPSTFMGVTCADDVAKLDARVAILGVPWDSGTSARPGARLGPKAIRNHWPWGQQGSPTLDGYFDFDTGERILDGLTVVDVGDVLILPSDFGPNFDRITESIRRVRRRGAFPVVLGGDHSITFPVVRGFDEIKGKIHIVQFDAHLDFGVEPRESRLSHAKSMRRSSELPFVSGVTNIGVRGLNDDEDLIEGRKRGVLDAVPARRALELGWKKVMASIPKAEHYYVTIDVDVLDPSLAPATGTPVPGGLSYYQLKDALRELARGRDIVGFDVVEYSPAYDHGEVTAAVVEQLVASFIGEVFKSRR